MIPRDDDEDKRRTMANIVVSLDRFIDETDASTLNTPDVEVLSVYP